MLLRRIAGGPAGLGTGVGRGWSFYGTKRSRARRGPQQWRVDLMGSAHHRGLPWDGYNLPGRPRGGWDNRLLGGGGAAAGESFGGRGD